MPLAEATFKITPLDLERVRGFSHINVQTVVEQHTTVLVASLIFVPFSLDYFDSTELSLLTDSCIPVAMETGARASVHTVA